MKKQISVWGLLVFVFWAGFFCAPRQKARRTNPVRQNLSTGWLLQDSAKVSAAGSQISTLAFKAKGWYPTTVPTTVLAALVADGVYKNIYYGKNLAKIPTEPFHHSWWFRKVFKISTLRRNKRIFLHFDGIVYRADVWVNGQKIASADSVEGVYRHFAFDVTPIVRVGKENVLAVQVFPPKPGDPSLGFVDWNPAPPDKNLGLWQPVFLRFSGEASLAHPQVITRLNLPDTTEAKLTLAVDVANHAAHAVEGIVKAQISSVYLSQKIRLKPRENRTLRFSPEKFKSLVLKHPKLWWPVGTGQPNLYSVHFELELQGNLSDSLSTRFGIREVGSYFNKKGYRVFTVNGKPILIRGGGWADDLLLADSPKKLEAKVKYARDMHLNAIRVEGIWGRDALYRLCDENGLLMLVGWSCQWEWKNLIGSACDQFGGIRSPHQMDVVVRSFRDQILRLRNHPSVLVWLYGSDKPPRPELEQRYVALLKKYDPTRPFLSSASQKPTSVTGNSGVKMSGPYEWVPPVYWYADTSRGGAFGFATEIGPGPEVPPLESVRRMIPPDHLWPIDDVWDFHCGRGKFVNLNVYTTALTNRYGKAESAANYCEKAQIMNYEGLRAMFEAYAQNKFLSTGVIQWMLNSAWPSMIWQLYDYYLMPGGAYFGTKKACEPVHIQYDYATHRVAVVNSTYQTFEKLTAVARVFSLNLHEKFEKSVPVAMAENTSRILFQIPEINGLSRTYFLDLRLKDASNREISSNFYWLSTQPDILDEAHANWYVTPTVGFADLTQLSDLPPVRLEASVHFSKNGKRWTAQVHVKNPSSKLAFFVELKIVRRDSGDSVLPIYWDENDFALLPGEKKVLTARFSDVDLRGQKPALKVGGWNVEPETLR